MYHRVTELPNDPNLLAVAPERFAEQLEVVRKYATPIRLAQLVEELRQGSVPKKAVVVTFDDGYVDNLHHAKPLLERYEIPATFFITTGQLGSQREFWWDELDRILLQPGLLPDSFRLCFNGREHEWELGEAAKYTEKEFERDRGWHIEHRSDPGPRQRLFRDLYRLMHTLSVHEQRRILNALRAWAEVDALGRSMHRTLTSAQLVQLNHGDLFEIGAHTMNHPILAALPSKEQRDEIEQSKTQLEAILQQPVVSFSYPHGSSTTETLSILEKLGFLCACSSEPEAVIRGTHRLELPRAVVRDWDREMFTHWLKGWIGG